MPILYGGRAVEEEVFQICCSDLDIAIDSIPPRHIATSLEVVQCLSNQIVHKHLK